MYGFALVAAVTVISIPMGAAHAWGGQQYQPSYQQYQAYTPPTYTNYNSNTTLYYNQQINYTTYTPPTPTYTYTTPTYYQPTYTQPSYNTYSQPNYSYYNSAYNYSNNYGYGYGYAAPYSYYDYH